MLSAQRLGLAVPELPLRLAGASPELGDPDEDDDEWEDEEADDQDDEEEDDVEGTDEEVDDAFDVR